MKTLIFILLGISFIPNAFATTEFYDVEYFTGEIFEIRVNQENVDITNISSSPQTLKFELKSTEGNIEISFPKAIPLKVNDGSNYPPSFSVIDAYDQRSVNTFGHSFSNSMCDYKIGIDFKNTRERSMELIIHSASTSSFTGLQLTYFDVEEYCFKVDPRNDTEIQRIIDMIDCSGFHLKAINLRNEAVCIKPDSLYSLIEREYLITKPIRAY